MRPMTLTELIGALALVVIVVGIGFYAAGWLNFDRSDETTTIQLETGPIGDAADRAVEEGKDLVEDAAEAVDKAMDDDKDDSAVSVDPETETVVR